MADINHKLDNDIQRPKKQLSEAKIKAMEKMAAGRKAWLLEKKRCEEAGLPPPISKKKAAQLKKVEIKEENNVESELEIKGVVFNEMKGAMSSISSQLWHGMSKHLYNSSTYKHNSGGDPESIIDLTHEYLVDFHKKHYHPSNATFFTFGDINPEEIQTIVYATGKENGYEQNLRDWFKLIYEVVFGEENGPRMGYFVSFFGLKETIELMKDKISNN